VQLALEGYYDGCIFHRVIKDFIAQTGDPTGTGTGEEGRGVCSKPGRVAVWTSADQCRSRVSRGEYNK
jgi:cyclophilin family peptidyl-prolyl cis-trans isomerase